MPAHASSIEISGMARAVGGDGCDRGAFADLDELRFYRAVEVRAEELRSIFDPIQVVQESVLDVGPCVSQRIIEAQGGRLDVKQARSEVSFTATLVAATQS